MAVYIVYRLLDLLQWLIILRCLISWFPSLRGSKPDQFFYMCTEPVIQPFRALLDRTGLFRGLPIDFSTLLAFFAVAAVQMLLRSLV